MNGRGCLPPGVWIHLPLGDLGRMVWKGVRRRLRLVLAWGHASAWFSPFWRGPAPEGQSTQAEREDCYGRATVALTRAIEHTYIVSPLDMAGMIGMAQTRWLLAASCPLLT